MDALEQIIPAVRLGERLVVRHRLADGSATDAIGWLEGLSEERLTLREVSGAVVEIRRPLIVAARRAPAARGGRDPMRTRPAELQRVALDGWFADREPLGEWTLRAGSGFTARANSCLAVGEPGVPTAVAAERIVEYAISRGARPWAQVVADSAEDRALQELGWTQVYVATDLLVARLAALLEGTSPDARVTVTETLQPEWEQAYRVSRPSNTDPAVVRRILENGPPRAFAGAGRAAARGLGAKVDEPLIAIGRGHVSGDWLGIAAVWTTPEHRRQGWAGEVLVSLGHWAARRGARNVYLQVAADNQAAHLAYERLGFRRHHGYRYLAAPG